MMRETNSKLGLYILAIALSCIGILTIFGLMFFLIGSRIGWFA